MKKRKIKWKTIIAALVAAAGLVIMVMMYARLKELTNQLVYLQDTTNIILSDVSGMQSNIEKTLKEEASMVESYSIEITDMDFAGKNYEVKATVIPKEYSEDTTVSVYFGTVECPLSLEGYAYTGSVKLPLNKSFDGNVTFLLANGKKKSTEVLEDYDGLGMKLGSVLSGRLEYAPTVKEGTLSLKSKCSFALEGEKQFQFESLELVALLDNEEIWTQNLFANMTQDPDETAENLQESVAGQQVEQPESERQTPEELLPVTSYASDMKCQFSYSLQSEGDEGLDQPAGDDPAEPQGQPENAMQKDHRIRLFLRAVSSDGYRFEYDVFRGDYRANEQELDPESFDWTAHSVAYDRKGNALKLE